MGVTGHWATGRVSHGDDGLSVAPITMTPESLLSGSQVEGLENDGPVGGHSAKPSQWTVWGWVERVGGG